MNGLFLAGRFSARKPVGTRGTQRVGATRSSRRTLGARLGTRLDPRRAARGT